MIELLATVEGILKPYLGVAAAVADNSHYVVAALEHFCYGMALPSNGDIGYSLPTEVMQRIQAQVTEAVLVAVAAGFGIVWPCRGYGFTIHGNDVIMEENEAIDPNAGYRTAPTSSFQQHLENGDFVPERMRRQ